jgi:hypothetical protein
MPLNQSNINELNQRVLPASRPSFKRTKTSSNDTPTHKDLDTKQPFKKVGSSVVVSESQMHGYKPANKNRACNLI